MLLDKTIEQGQFQFKERHLDRLAGTDEVRKSIDQDSPGRKSRCLAGQLESI